MREVMYDQKAGRAHRSKRVLREDEMSQATSNMKVSRVGRRGDRIYIGIGH